jgi:hypothetical protein
MGREPTRDGGERQPPNVSVTLGEQASAGSVIGVNNGQVHVHQAPPADGLNRLRSIRWTPKGFPPNMSNFSNEEITELATVFPPGSAARSVLGEAEYPAAALPAMIGVTGFEFWFQISDAVANGILENGRAEIFAVALRRYPYNPVFRRAVAARAKTAEQ